MTTVRIKIPSGWDALSEKQLVRLAKILLPGSSPGTRKEQLRLDLEIFKILTGECWWNIKMRAKRRIITSIMPLSDLKKHYSWIYEGVTRTIFPGPVKVASRQLFPPMQGIANLSIDEFAVADDLHIRFRETGKLEYLRYLGALLYVDAQQPRPPFDKNNLPFLAERFRRVPLPFLLAVEMTWSGCKNDLASRFRRSFPTSSGSASGKRSKKEYGWGKVILQMAGGKFGNLAETKATNVYSFLEEFNTNLETIAKK